MADSQIILVTGGASGIGLAVAQAALAEGWRVILADLDQGRLEEARDGVGASEGQIRCERLDVSDETAVVATLARCEAEFGPIAGVVNSAGIARDLPALETGADLFRTILSVNVVGSFLVAREAARHMRSRAAGSIINIASVSGLRGNPGRAAYGASKGGVVTMTQVLAVEWAELGIRVNAIAPGPIETPMVLAMHSSLSRSAWINSVPMRRYGTPAEIASTALFLLDERKSGFITGQTIAVDGGFSTAGVKGRMGAPAAMPGETP